MATVTSFTSARMLEIENTTVVDGEIQGDNLVLLQRDGTPINAGNVRGPQGPQGNPGAGNVDTVNGKFGPNVVLVASDVGAVATNQYATTAVQGIARFATAPEVAAGIQVQTMLAPATFRSVAAARYEKTTTSIAELGSGDYTGQLALAVISSLPVEVVWTGAAWRVLAGRLVGTTAQRTAWLAASHDGLVFFDTTLNREFIKKSSAWFANGYIDGIMTSIAQPGTQAAKTDMVLAGAIPAFGYDTSGYMQSTAGITAPRTGLYDFFFEANSNGITATTCMVSVNDTDLGAPYRGSDIGASGAATSVAVAMPLKLNAGDVVKVNRTHAAVVPSFGGGIALNWIGAFS